MIFSKTLKWKKSVIGKVYSTLKGCNYGKYVGILITVTYVKKRCHEIKLSDSYNLCFTIFEPCKIKTNTINIPCVYSVEVLTPSLYISTNQITLSFIYCFYQLLTFFFLFSIIPEWALKEDKQREKLIIGSP